MKNYRIIAVIVSLVSSVYAFSQGSFNVDNISYTEVGKNEVEVTKCHKEGKVVIPEKVNGYVVSGIGEYSFFNIAVDEVVLPSTVTYIKSLAFYGCAMTSIDLGKSLKSIGNRAFWYCNNLTTVDLPSSLINIDDYAFQWCRGLEYITIPENVSCIRPGVFSGCNSLKKLTVAEGNKMYDSRDNCNAIVETSTNTLISGCMSTTVPDGITKIGDQAFYESQITSLVLPNSVKTIGENAFSNCRSLTSIVLPESLQKIENYSFYNCENLQSVTFPKSLLYIGYAAFFNCKRLSNIDIAENLSFVGADAFTNIPEFNITLRAMVPPVAIGQLVDGNAQLTIPLGTGDLYKSSIYWMDFATITESADAMPLAIKSITSDKSASQEAYTLDGRRANSRTTGIIIRNGKKVLVRN